MIRSAGIALLAATALAGCGGGSPAKSTITSTGPTGSAVRPLRLQSQLVAFKVLPEAGRAGSPGAQLIITGMLFTQHARRASGRSQAVCTRTGTGPGEVFQCSIAFLLPEGTIYGEGVASQQGIASGIVAGGTGRYAGDRGTFRYRAHHPRVGLEFALRR